MEEDYIAYLALPVFEEGYKWRSAFAINPTTRRFGWAQRRGYQNSLSKAKQAALDNCGEGCKIFDVDQKIVWGGFEAVEKYEVIADALKKTDVKIKKYNPQKFKISSKQLAMYEEKYLGYVEENYGKKAVFAISPDGQTAQWFHSKRSNTFKLGAVVIRMCNAVSGEPTCVVYAYGNEPVTQ